MARPWPGQASLPIWAPALLRDAAEKQLATAAAAAVNRDADAVSQGGDEALSVSSVPSDGSPPGSDSEPEP